MSKRPYTIRGTERFATGRSQGSPAKQTNRGHAEAAAGQADAAAVRQQEAQSQSPKILSRLCVC